MLRFFRKKKQDPARELRRVMGEYRLPSFPSVLLSALQELRDPEYDPTAVASLLSRDPGVSVKLLQTVNSAAFALRRKISAVEDAVLLLGRKPVEAVVLSLAVGEAMPETHLPGLDAHQFWSASARRATAARSLARILSPGTEMRCFTAGLLQDMALPFLASWDTRHYAEILEEWRDQGGNLAELERRELDWDHAEVASWLGYEWGFPEDLIIDIATHHEPLGRDAVALTPVGLVSYLRDEDSDPAGAALLEAAEGLGYSRPKLDPLLQEAFQEAREVALVLQ